MRRILMIAVLGCLIGAGPLIGQETGTTTAPATQKVTATLYKMVVIRYAGSPTVSVSTPYEAAVWELYVPSMGIAVIDGHVVPVDAKRYAPPAAQTELLLQRDESHFVSVKALFDIQMSAADIEHLQEAEKEYRKSLETVMSPVNAEQNKRAKQ